MTETSEPGLPGTTERWRWVYSELLRIEAHRAEELQNQQHRIASVLAVNGFLFAFLASGGLIQRSALDIGWQQTLFVLAVCVLGVGLVVGLESLRPRITLRGARPAEMWPDEPDPVRDASLFLNPRWYVDDEPTSALHLAPAKVMEVAARALAHNIASTDAAGTMKRRRSRIQLQMICTFVGLIAVVIALIGSIF